MAQFEFKLPDIGEGVVEGEIVKWLVKPGDDIIEDQPLVEVMTDKATVTIPSPRKGKVVRTVGGEGDIAKVHSTLIVLEVGGGAGATTTNHGAPSAAPGAGAHSAPATAQSAPSIAPSHAGDPAPLQTAGPGTGTGKALAPTPGSASAAEHGASGGTNGQERAKVLATPVTRKMARELGIDLADLQGSGPNARVMKADLLAHVEQKGQGEQASPGGAQARGAARPEGGEERIPLRGLRKKIAESMVKSKFTAPHFTFVEECDTKDLSAMRARLNASLGKQGLPKLSYLPFIAKALVRAFRKYPHLNAVMDEARQELVVKQDVNLGIAAATDAGLTVFIVKDVARLSLREIGSEIERMSKAAREQKLKMQELQGGTFTITSLGRDGGLLATPIIHHPEVAILGVHRLQEKPIVVRDGKGEPRIEIGERMNFSCSFDHRVIDGHIGAAFLYEMIRGLEAPEMLLADC